MRYCVEMSKEESSIEQWEKLIGSYMGTAKLEKVVEMTTDQYTLRFNGSIKDYLRCKCFFGKANVFKRDWRTLNKRLAN